jgi:hypothetical protein
MAGKRGKEIARRLSAQNDKEGKWREGGYPSSSPYGSRGEVSTPV